MRNDTFDLQRFVSAQEATYSTALQELKSGRKRSHWMWFIFPQLRGLGSSSTAQAYAIASSDEARAYWQHHLLGLRLTECTQAVLDLQDRSAETIFAYPDHLKFRSCMTLFAASVPQSSLFPAALKKYFDGEPDAVTLRLLGGQSS
jgi:uncharacterized protein (DUF1810 family)